MRSARINYDKIESKPGRSLTKKWSEHKGHTHPRHSATGSPTETLMEDELEKYQSHFSESIKRRIEADNMEELYKKVHAAIRAGPTPSKSTKEPPKEHKRYNLKKLTYEERKAKLNERLNALNSSTGTDDDDDDDDDDEDEDEDDDE